MSTAHGAGLMVAPVLIGAGAATEASASSDHAIAAVQENGLSIPGSLLGITLHVGGDARGHGRRGAAGLRPRRGQRAQEGWINLDAVWAGAFVSPGC